MINGDEMSAHFNHIKKLTINQFDESMPKGWEADIKKHILHVAKARRTDNLDMIFEETEEENEEDTENMLIDETEENEEGDQQNITENNDTEESQAQSILQQKRTRKKPAYLQDFITD